MGFYRNVVMVNYMAPSLCSMNFKERSWESESGI